MECPNCLEKLSASGINAYDCLYCNGNWLTGTLIYDLLIKDKKNPSIEQLQISFKKQNENNIKRICPQCVHKQLYVTHIHNIEIDFCEHCHGVFFDEGELQKVFKLKKIDKPKEIINRGTAYVATEGLFWILISFISGGSC